MYTRGGDAINKARSRDRSLTLTGFIKQSCYRYLSQEVLLRVVVERRDGPAGAKPRIYSNVVFFAFAKAAVVGDADVFLQLGYLRQRPLEKEEKSAGQEFFRKQLENDRSTLKPAVQNISNISLSCF